MKFFLIIFFVSAVPSLSAQYIFKAVVEDSITREALANVSVTGNDKHGKITDAAGFVQFDNINTQRIHFIFRLVGYEERHFTTTFPDTVTHIIFLRSSEAALGDVTVLSTVRSNERIENATTKVEVLGQEEMNEESTIKPGSIASILGDVSGIQVQQSSVASGNANVRIQGLDGKYTQLLRDGMPLFEGYSGGFGILSIPPLDLKQVELIKGPASTLYGGGAIAGLVNLISKKPSFVPDASFLINQTTLKETNINAYYAQRWKHIGFTLFSGQNFQQQVDVNKDGLSDLPHLYSTLIHPVLFIYPSAKSYISLGWSGSFESRTGGDMQVLEKKKDAQHIYFEKNKLNRNTFTLIAENRFTNQVTATIKSSVSIFNRAITTNTYAFTAQQINHYTEASATVHVAAHAIVSGLNVTSNIFQPSRQTPVPVGSFSNLIFGAFAQDTWQLSEHTKIEGGLRLDHHTTYGNSILPRLALFHHFTKYWGARAGFGMGYTTPDPLSPQIKDYGIYAIQPVAAGIKAEKSYGGNIEVNYKKNFGADKSIFFNQAFFFTRISNPVIAGENTDSTVSFSNAFKPIVTKGFDTYIQATLKGWELYLGYTYTDAQRTYLSYNSFMLLTSHHRAAAVISYEKDSWRFGLEGSYNSYQHREDYSKTPGYLFLAAMIEKKIGATISLVLNCENALDERQSKYESLFTGSISYPDFKALWAPIDGRVINFCLRWKPFAKEKD